MLSTICSLLLAHQALAAAPACGGRDHVLLQHGRASLTRTAEEETTTTFIPHPQNLEDWPETIFFDAVIRDFTADHPDFQSFDGHAEGLVEPELGTDKKPVFKGGLQLSNNSNFDQWFRDVPGVNRRFGFKMDFNRTAEGTYVHEDASFFPVDGRGWRDTAVGLDGHEHNFYFTLELHTTFVYQGGEHFTFRGDDDVWVFMNGHLVIDLGGVHDPLERTFAIDSLNLTEGSAVELSFFFAERRCCGSEFRMETSIVPVKGTCTVWGDPHVDVFDNGLFGREKVEPVSIYTSGDYWLVKSDLVKIQARYGTTQFSVGGQSSLLQLAVGGSFFMNHTLIIEPMDDGQVTFDGEPILEEFPSQFVRPFTHIKFMEGKKHIDDALEGYPVKLIRAFMLRNVELTVNRWPKHIDAIIRMPQQLGGQDGHCGNFNFNVSDDTKELILERIGVPVLAEESLFPDGKKMVDQDVDVHTEAHHEVTLEDCAPERRHEARVRCEALVGDGARDFRLQTCIFDYCFAGKEFAAEDVIVEQESESM